MQSYGPDSVVIPPLPHIFQLQSAAHDNLAPRRSLGVIQSCGGSKFCVESKTKLKPTFGRVDSWVGPVAKVWNPNAPLPHHSWTFTPIHPPTQESTRTNFYFTTVLDSTLNLESTTLGITPGDLLGAKLCPPQGTHPSIPIFLTHSHPCVAHGSWADQTLATYDDTHGLPT